MCKQLAQGLGQKSGGRDSNSRPVDHKSGSLTTRPSRHYFDNHAKYGACKRSQKLWAAGPGHRDVGHITLKKHAPPTCAALTNLFALVKTILAEAGPHIVLPCQIWSF